MPTAPAAIAVGRHRPLVLAWPAQADHRAAAQQVGRPSLLVVAPGAPIPVTGPLEDWIRAGAGELDVARRLEGLAAAAQRAASDAGYGASEVPSGTLPGLVGLDGRAARVARVLLLRAERLVPRVDLSDGDGDARDGRGSGGDLDRAVDQVRRALDGSGWAVARVQGHGFVAHRQEAS